MKPSNSLCLLLMTSMVGGCVIKPAPVSTRQFVLAPIPTAEHAPARALQLQVEVGLVKMPAYLLRDSMVIRKSTDEIEYLETALWAERLDQSFRQTLEKNLSLLIASDGAILPASERDRIKVRVSVIVEQFDVDSKGQGTLLARWRLTAAGADTPMKIGHAHLTRPGPSPRGNPQAVSMTLSALLAEFSRDLAQALRESGYARHQTRLEDLGRLIHIFGGGPCEIGSGPGNCHPTKSG
jgi:uncharacterized lipoprotein YmbA